jgi:hypothetical protein
MISAEEARRVWTAADAQAYTAAESAIDAVIRKSDEGCVEVNLSSIDGLRRTVCQRLSTAYQEGGWIVTWSDGDQQNPGPHVKLTVASGPRSGR